MADDPKAAIPTGEASDRLLRTIRQQYDESTEVWQPIRDNGALNMRFVSGDPFTAEERKRFEDAGRPCVSFDEINQHTNQVINDVRNNRRGVKFSPVGRGANDKTAEFYQDKMREIEYRSSGQIVYTTAFQNAVERSYGWMRVKTEYVRKSFNQEIWLEEFVNPDAVLPDVNAKRPSFIDQNYCFVHEARKREAFKREFPNARITDFGAEHMEVAKRWIHPNDLVIAEYWSRTMRKKELLRLKVPKDTAVGKFEMMEAYADELPGSRLLQYVVDRREEEVPYVCSYMTNGVELLSPKQEWPGQYIPIIACVGKIAYLTEGGRLQRKIQAMVDLMRDPQKAYGYTRTNQTELTGMTPKTPVVGYEGQFRGHEAKWATINHQPQPYLEARATTEETGSQILPLPQRQPYDPPIERLEMLAEGQIRAIRSAAGSTPLPSAAARRSEKSGVALKRIEDMVKVGSYHFVDHYNDMIEAVGVIVEDVMDKIYDAARDVAVRRVKGSKETTETVRINEPNAPYPSLKGEHQVTVSTGPSFENEQEAGSDLADSLMGLSDPEVLRAVLPLAVKLKNQGPIGDELVEMLETLQPPPVQQLRQSKDKAPNPQQLMAELSQMRERIQMAEQAMQGLAQEADGKKLEAETKLQIAERDNAARVQVAEIAADKDLALQVMRNAATIATAHIAASAKGAAIDAHAEEERQALAHDAALSELDREAAAVSARQDQDHQAAMASASSETTAANAEAQRAFEAEQAAAAAAREVPPE